MDYIYNRQDQKQRNIKHLTKIIREQKKIVVQIVDSYRYWFRYNNTEVPINDLNQIMQECLNQQVQIYRIQLHSQRLGCQLEDQIFLHINYRQPNLVCLKIQRLIISLKGLTILEDSNFKLLKNLQLCNNNINQKGAKILASCDFEALQEFSLFNNKIRNKGIEHLAKGNWPNLIFLNIDAIGISADGLRALPKANWPKIKQVIVAVKQSFLFSGCSLNILCKEYFHGFCLKQVHGYGCNNHDIKNSCYFNCRYAFFPSKQRINPIRTIDDIQ